MKANIGHFSGGTDWAEEALEIIAKLEKIWTGSQLKDSTDSEE